MKLITLTTDFGDSNNYVALFKGVILTVNSELTIVDILKLDNSWVHE